LAGYALLTYSFEIIANDPLLSDSEKVKIVQLLSKSSGPAGMEGGQIYDIRAEKEKATFKDLERIHNYKTGELIKLAIITAAYLAEESIKDLEHITEFANYLGLIFKI